MSKTTTAESIAEQARDYYRDTLYSAITAEDIQKANDYTNEHLRLTVEVMDALGIFHASDRMLVAIAQAMRATLDDIEAQAAEAAAAAEKAARAAIAARDARDESAAAKAAHDATTYADEASRAAMDAYHLAGNRVTPATDRSAEAAEHAGAAVRAYYETREAIAAERQATANAAALALIDAYAEAIGEYPAEDDPETRSAYVVAHDEITGRQYARATAANRALVADMVEAIAEHHRRQCQYVRDAEEQQSAGAMRDIYVIAICEGETVTEERKFASEEERDEAEERDYTSEGYEYANACDVDEYDDDDNLTIYHIDYLDAPAATREWHMTVDIDETAQDFTAPDIDADDEDEARELLRQAWNRRKPRRMHLAADTDRIIDVYSY